MNKKQGKRFLSLIMAFLLLLSLMPVAEIPVMAAYSDSGSGNWVPGKLSYSWKASSEGDSTNGASGSATVSGTGLTIEATSSKYNDSGCDPVDAASTTTEVTVTNSSSSPLRIDTLSYSGKASISGASVGKTLAVGDTFLITITATPDSTTDSNSHQNTDIIEIAVTELSNVTITAIASPYMSYTLNGNSVSANGNDVDFEVAVGSSVVLPAITAPTGYKFLGWRVNGALKADEFTAANNTTVYPTIVPESLDTTSANFTVGGESYTFWEDAVAAAVSSSNKTVVLAKDYSLPTSMADNALPPSGQGTYVTGADGNITYVVPYGITFLVPFDDANTVYRATPEVIYNSYDRPSAFRTLTMNNGTNLSIEDGGAVSLSGKLSAKGQMGGYNGTPTGPDGRINMKSGSTITVNSGGNLYCWGYIYGSGAVEAKSGATVHEAFQIKDWRGGSATSSIASYAFILSQYYAQNIEVPLTLYAGAIEKLYSAANASSTAYPMGATLIGPGGLFNISSGYVVKDYIESSDRLQFDIYGDVSVTPMTLTGLPLVGSISTGDFVMPITSNMTLNIHSGTASVTQDIKLLPGAEITVDDGATFSIASGKKVYLYDNDNWGNYTGTAKLYVIGYSVANGTAAKRTAASLVDAKIDVNGELQVYGNLYTSEGGANITTSGTGKVVLKTAPGSDSTIYEMADNKTKTSVTFNPARLHNGDGTYTETAGKPANTTFYYCTTCNPSGIWETAHTAEPATVTFHKNHDTDETLEVTLPFDFIAPTDAWAYTGHTFKEWNTAADGSGDSYQVGASASFAEDIDLYAIWEPIQYTITWNIDGATKTSQVAYGETPVYPGETPTKEADAQYSYTFAGWDPEIVAVTDDATYTATFTKTVKTYTVTWKNEDGTVLETDENVPYGSTPTYDGETPAKAATAQYTYTFAGWTPAIADVTGDATYTATYNSTENTYTVTWKNEDGTVLETDENVPYGTTPVYDDETPTKAADAQYTYTFSGWTPAVTAVTGDATYTATYSSTVNKYTVTWKNEDGTVLETDENVPYGTTPTFDGETPTKAADAQYTYTFEKWSPAVANVTGNVTYTATFAETVKTYTVTWKNEDGTVLETDENVPYGTTPTYDGETPTKARDAQYSYSFNGWDTAPAAITGDTTYTATFDSSVNSYTITWKNDDGSVIDTTTVTYGVTPSHADPTKEADAEYTYTFAGWNPAIATVTGDAEYQATYTAQKNMYTITFLNDDGSTIKTEEVEYGTVPEAPEATKPATDQYTYTFAGWTPEIAEVTGEATYTATFTPVTREYTIKFVNEDGTELQSGSEEYGETPVYAGETPAKAATAQHTYTFAGWTPEIAPVTGTATYTATFTETVNKYTVTFVNEDGTELQTSEVEYGTVPTYTGETPTKAPTAEFTYIFAGWDPVITEVTGDATYTATFTEETNTYTVSWNNADGTVLETDENVLYGEMPSYDGETPVKAADEQYTYTFAGWTPEVKAVEGNVTYTATYSSTVNTYAITWVDGDGNTLYTELVAYGENPAYSGDTPTKTATEQYTYSFNNTWTPEIAAVTGEATYTAQFDSTVNQYLIQFVDDDGEVLKSEMLEYGATPTAPAEPTKAADVQFTYTFNGWDKNIVPVEGEEVYTATYTSTERSYTITWKDYNGDVLGSGSFTYGATPFYSGDTPKRTQDPQFTYEFIGWNPEIVNVSGDAEYTAVYSETTRTYAVTWVNWDDEPLGTDEVAYGETPVYNGQTPTKPEDSQYTYTFSGWTPEIAAVSGEVTYKATYSETLRTYTVSWKNEDGTVLETDENVAYGTTPSYDGAVPTKASDAQYSYTFSGWTPSVSRVTGEATYTATFSSTLRTYTVTWKNYDGKVLEKDTNVAYGTVPTYDGEAPVRATDSSGVYTFSGWDPEVTGVTGNVIYTATYDRENSVTIQFVSQDMSWSKIYDIDVSYIAKSDSIVLPDAPQYEYYNFEGWFLGDADKTPVTAETVTAAAQSLLNSSSTVTVIAKYSRPTYNVAIRINEDGVLTDKVIHTTESYMIGKSINLTAGKYHNKELDHWEIDGVSYYTNDITFMGTDSKTYEAIAYYFTQEVVPENPVTFRVVNQYAETVGTKKQIAVTVEFTMPSDYTIDEVGFMYTTSESKKNALDPWGKKTGWTKKGRDSETLEDITTATYTLHVNISKIANPLYIFGYLYYEDAEGEWHELYCTQSSGVTDDWDAEQMYDTLYWASLSESN